MKNQPVKNSVVVLLLFFTLLTRVQAQLCTGSLGDPVVNSTFGNSNTLPGPLKPNVTNLSYIGIACPVDGQYTITNASSGCFGNSWHTLTGDHTGDNGGRFMLINASFTPNDFYVDTITSLCGGTTYEFASWVVNVLKSSSCGGAGIQPNLTFQIETVTGSILQRFDTGDIPADGQPIWKQYGTFFTTPSGTGSIVLRITNNAKGGCGNDLAIDDITFRPCGPKTTAHADNDTTGFINLCENNQPDLHFNASYSGGFNSPVLQWQLSKDSGHTWVDIPGERAASYTRKPTVKGFYQYRVMIAELGNFSSPQCRIASSVTSITVNTLPASPPVDNLSGCTNASIQLKAVTGAGFSYRWLGPNGFTDTAGNPILSHLVYADSGLYKVTIVTNTGCTRTDTVKLKVYPGVKAVISPAVNICEGGSTVLAASGGNSYTWTPATGLSDKHTASPVAAPTDTTAYQVLVQNEYGCKDSAQTVVNVWKKPVVNAGPDQVLFEGQSATLHGTLKGAASGFNWTPAVFMTGANTLMPVVSPDNSITYALTATSAFGCGSSADSVFVKVYRKVTMANAFSPNGDGINDTWIIKGLDSYPGSVISLFNRTGQLLFQSKGYPAAWDGTYKNNPLPVGTYYYLINLNVGLPVISGWVLLIR